MAAAGAVLHLFPTGQGNVIGHPVEPVIKLTANPLTAQTMAEHIDLDCAGLLRRQYDLTEAWAWRWRSATGPSTAAPAPRPSGTGSSCSPGCTERVMPALQPGRVRWGVIGAAGIARKAFLPAVAEAGGVAAAVAGRDPERTARWARDNGVDRAVAGYQQLIEDPQIGRGLHPAAQRPARRVATSAPGGPKPVLCEAAHRPRCPRPSRSWAVAAETGTLLWEALVFPFHDQMRRIRVSSWPTGPSASCARSSRTTTSPCPPTPGTTSGCRPALAGGALNDVGCYPVRLARFPVRRRARHGVRPPRSGIRAAWTPETWGWLGFPGDRRLLLSCGFRRAQDTFSALIGDRRADTHHQPVPPRAGGPVRGARRGADRPATRGPGRTGIRSPRRSGTSRTPSAAGSHRAGSRPTPRSARPGRSATSRPAPGALSRVRRRRSGPRPGRRAGSRSRPPPRPRPGPAARPRAGPGHAASPRRRPGPGTAR